MNSFVTTESRCVNTELAENLWTCYCITSLKQQQQQQQSNPLQLQPRLSGGSYTLHFLSDAVASWPAAANHWGLGGAWATQAASWWAVDEVRGHCRAKWDLTLDKQARPRATVAYGCEGGEEAEEGWEWGGAKLSTPPLTRPPAVTTDTYQPSH